MTETTERADRILKNREYRSMLNSIRELEKNRKFCRHTEEHFFDTARIMYIIALEERLNIPKDMIYAAALLHDIGRAQEYQNGISHEKASADIARRLLPQCGYTAEETETVVSAVLCHRDHTDSAANTNPDNNLLGALLYRADKLSRPCFLCSARDECYWSKQKKNHTITY